MVIALYIQCVVFGHHLFIMTNIWVKNNGGGLETQSFRNGRYLDCRCTEAHRLDLDYTSAL